MGSQNRHVACLVGALVLSVMLGASVPAWAQLAVEPEVVSVSAAQGEEVTRILVLRNAGSEALGFCVSFERPLERVGEVTQLSATALGSACGDYGEVLALVGESAVAPQLSWDPYGLAMTPDGRLFASEDYGIPSQTYELTPSLEYVRSFVHPLVAEVTSGAVTLGVAYNADTETLWWLNSEGSGFTVERALLLEGTLDGEPTGRRIELPVAQTAPPPGVTGAPGGLAYDAAEQVYYYADAANDDVWAVDTLGRAVDGYPVQLDAYPEADLGSLDAHGGSDGLYIDLVVSPEGPAPGGPASPSWTASAVTSARARRWRRRCSTRCRGPRTATSPASRCAACSTRTGCSTTRGASSATPASWPSARTLCRRRGWWSRRGTARSRRAKRPRSR